MATYINGNGGNFLSGAYNNQYSSVSIDVALVGNDFAFDPVGNLDSVAGNEKLVQDIELFLLSPVGTSPIDRTWGNPSLKLLGQAEVTKGQLENLINGSLALLKQFKDAEAKTRLVDATELIESYGDITITPLGTTDNKIQVQIRVVTKDDHSGSTLVRFVTSGI